MTISGDATDGRAAMRWLAGGTCIMGSDRFYAEERPVRQVRVDPFRIDVRPVTNRDFARFVSETGYLTLAERAPDPLDYPEMLPEMARPGSLIFVAPSGPVDLTDPYHWWSYCFGADWSHPAGPESTLAGLDDHPVVHVAHTDAAAYAAWAGKSLPTEAEWEFAARGGSIDTEYAWGDELAPDGMMLANYWQGAFPVENLLLDGWERTSPTGTFPPNAFGLSDMIGNVWEWTDDWWSVRGVTEGHRACCVPANSRVGCESDRAARGLPDIAIGRKVVKGGSYLCAPNYCQRYRPAARQAQAIDSATANTGFRCVSRST